jgi:iron(III) transport system permease protein
MRVQRLYRYVLLALLVAAMAMFLIWPIVLTVNGGFRAPDGSLTFRYVVSVFEDPLWVQGLINSLLIASATTVLCLLIVMPLSLLAARYDFPAKPLVTSLLLVPLILPPFVGAIGLRALMGRFGSLNALLTSMGLLDPESPGIDFLGGAVGGRFWGVVIMEALHLYPILYLNVTAALANLDPSLDEAARGLGAGRFRRFFTITLPLIMPGLFAGATIVFIWSFTELGTPLMFDYYTVTPVQIFWGIQEVANNPRPYALVVVMLTVAVVLYAMGKFAFGRRSYEMKGKATVGSTTAVLRGWRGWAATALFLSITALAVLPHIGVVFSSFTVNGSWYRTVLPAEWTGEHYSQALSHSLAMGSIRNSLFYAVVAMVLAVTLGLAISYLTVRVKITGGWLLDSMAMLPLAVPGLVMAFGYVAMTLVWPFAPASEFCAMFVHEYHVMGLVRTPEALAGWLSRGPLAGISVMGAAPNPVPLLIVAYAIRRLPYVVRAASAGLEQTSGELEEAAWNLGASKMTAIRRIVVPLIMANLIAGAILAFSFSMLEVSDSLVLAQKEVHYPITKAIYELFNRLGDGPYIASAMGVWGMALLTITLVGASVMMGKRMGAIFRV